MKILTKNKSLCYIFIVINIWYPLFLIFESQIFLGKLDFNDLYIPGLVFSFLIFPATCIFLWRIKERFLWIDFTFIVIPLLLWMFVIPGGSFTTFLFMNFPVIWTVSLIYLFRFNSLVRDKKVYPTVLALWILVTLVSLFVCSFMPALPE